MPSLGDIVDYLFSIVDVIVVVFVLLIPLLIVAKRKNILGEFLLGMVFGIIWELITKPFWDYNTPLNIIDDISILLVIAWGVIFVSTTWYAESIKNRFEFRSYFIPDLISSMIGLAFEWIFFTIYSAWEYAPVIVEDGVVPLLDLPVFVVLGWPVLVVIYNNFIRTYDPMIEKWAQGRGVSLDLRE